MENNYSDMSNLILDSITIYGLENIPAIINVNSKQFYPKIKPFTQIVDFTGFGLSMDKNYTLTWSTTRPITIQVPELISKHPKYNVDCSPDPGYNRKLL